ncbi:MAG: hypothetical protein ACETVZ_01570 [Phycisphaerae bacterium]
MARPSVARPSWPSFHGLEARLPRVWYGGQARATLEARATFSSRCCNA